jgi:hypothetical protein
MLNNLDSTASRMVSNRDLTGKPTQPGLTFKILQMKDFKKFKLLKISDPWNKMQWQGDWSEHSQLWTPQMRNECNYYTWEKGGSP